MKELRDLPSGRIFDEEDLILLEAMADAGFVQYRDEPFTFRSGFQSRVYVYGREDVTDNPELGWLIGHKIARYVYSRTGAGESRQNCLIGIPTAGTALASAASFTSIGFSNKPNRQVIAYRIMREALKTYGAHKTWVNGAPDLDRHIYWAIDNTATDGQSKFDVAEKLVRDGYPAFEMDWLICIDRQLGALEKMAAGGFKKVHALFELLDVTYAFTQMRRWSKAAFVAVEQEIRAQQARQ